MTSKKIKNKFENIIPTAMNPEGTSMWAALAKMIRGVPGRSPGEAIETIPVDPIELEIIDYDFYLFLGHSSIFIQLEGVRIMIDPVFNSTASPIPFVGPKAFTYTHNYHLNKFPNPDIILISHDHYDHLDKKTIKLLCKGRSTFICPLEVGIILKNWGVDSERIVELDWDDSFTFRNKLTITAKSARHFSGRGILNRMTTLWCSFAIRAGNQNIFYSGDSGYGPHFKDIGEQSGPFNHAFIECGQYNVNWPLIHMMPEETVQAAIDLNTKSFMPIHWSKFALSLHPWDEPPKRAATAAKARNQNIIIPKIGKINRLQ